MSHKVGKVVIGRQIGVPADIAITGPMIPGLTDGKGQGWILHEGSRLFAKVIAEDGFDRGANVQAGGSSMPSGAMNGSNAAKSDPTPKSTMAPTSAPGESAMPGGRMGGGMSVSTGPNGTRIVGPNGIEFFP